MWWCICCVYTVVYFYIVYVYIYVYLHIRIVHPQKQTLNPNKKWSFVDFLLIVQFLHVPLPAHSFLANGSFRFGPAGFFTNCRDQRWTNQRWRNATRQTGFFHCHMGLWDVIIYCWPRCCSYSNTSSNSQDYLFAVLLFVPLLWLQHIFVHLQNCCHPCCLPYQCQNQCTRHLILYTLFYT